MTNLASLAAPEVAVTTTPVLTMATKVGIITTLDIRWSNRPQARDSIYNYVRPRRVEPMIICFHGNGALSAAPHKGFIQRRMVVSWDWHVIVKRRWTWWRKSPLMAFLFCETSWCQFCKRCMSTGGFAEIYLWKLFNYVPYISDIH